MRRRFRLDAGGGGVLPEPHRGISAATSPSEKTLFTSCSKVAENGKSDGPSAHLGQPSRYQSVKACSAIVNSSFKFESVTDSKTGECQGGIGEMKDSP